MLSDVLVLPDVEKISFEQVIAVGVDEIYPVENQVGILLVFAKFLDVAGHVHAEIPHSVEGVLDYELALLLRSVVICFLVATLHEIRLASLQISDPGYQELPL